MSNEAQERFYDACRRGALSTVESLIGEVDINRGNGSQHDSTGLIMACSCRNEDVLRYLLAQPGIDVNQVNQNGWTALFTACVCESTEALRILVRDERVEVNKADCLGCTPLWRACLLGNEEAVKILLASRRDIDAIKEGLYGNLGLSPAGVARRKGFNQIAQLVEEFMENPQEVRARLRRELKWITKAAEIFALGTLVSDGYLKLKGEEEDSQLGRFFKIYSKLHLDVQMVLINRSQGLMDLSIPRDEQNLALLKSLHSSHFLHDVPEPPFDKEAEESCLLF